MLRDRGRHSTCLSKRSSVVRASFSPRLAEGIGLREEGHLDSAVFLVALLIFMGIPAFTVLRVARLRAARPQSPSADVTARLEAVERVVQDLQQQLAETHERLDFTERLLGKAREERRIGG